LNQVPLYAGPERAAEAIGVLTGGARFSTVDEAASVPESGLVLARYGTNFRFTLLAVYLARLLRRQCVSGLVGGTCLWGHHDLVGATHRGASSVMMPITDFTEKVGRFGTQSPAC
jgi:hypothetical protein